MEKVMKPSLFQGVESNPDAAARRLMQRAHNRDGLPEIAVGVGFLAVALLMWMQVVFQPGSLAYGASTLGMILLVALICGGSPWAIKWARRRFLTERVGYVQLKPAPRRQSIVIIGIAVVVAAAAAWAAYRGSVPPRGWVLTGTGILGGLIAAFAGRLPRYVVGGVVMAVVGIALGFSRVPMETGFLILYGSMGMLSLVSGCVVFLHLLRMPEERAG
jgi:hypothetical protein